MMKPFSVSYILHSPRTPDHAIATAIEIGKGGKQPVYEISEGVEFQLGGLACSKSQGRSVAEGETG